MATIKGNYWLDLIEKEKRLKGAIESTIRKSIGKKFSDYTDMTMKIKDDIRIELENYGVKHHMGIFHLEYDLDLKYDSSFILTGFDVKFVYLNEDVW
jgi:hypothetical protein